MSAKSSTPIPKFRPVLSAHQISHILRLAKRDGSKESQSLIASLAKIEWQINNNALTPAYVSTPQPSLVEDLGFDEPKDTHAHVSNDDASIESLYNIWLQTPESLNLTQLARVRQWRYENEKMTMDEEKLFEHEVLGMT